MQATKPPKRNSRSRARSWHRPPTGPLQQPSLALQQISESLAPPRHRSSTDDIFTEPQRLHKVLASCGFGSRRAMEEMILAGRITVNREPADVGQKVGPGDEVRINGELVRVRFAEPRARILMYHKPAGEIVTRDDPEGRPTVFEKLPNIGNGRWIAIGRLDFNTEGLLLFTNAGELANKMMHPRYEVEREYAVRIMGLLTPEQEQSLLTGVTLDDGPAKIEKLVDGGGEGSNHWYHIVIKEGRNREVRRIFEALGLTVSRLIRTRYGTVAMPSRVKRGQTLELTADEVGAVLVAAGLKATALPPQKPGQGGKARGQGGRPQGQPGRPQGQVGGRPQGQPGRPQGQAGRSQGQAGRPQGQGGWPQGNGPRAPGQGQRDRGPRGPQRDAHPPREASPDLDAIPDVDVIEPGNSVHGLPTHGNTPVGKFFAKTHSKPHGRPQGPGGPRRGPPGQATGGRGFAQHGRPQHGKPHLHDRSGGHGASPYVMTTLTVPGAVPEGLPGTEGRGPRGPGAGNGTRGQGAGQGKNRGRDRNRSDAQSEESPGNAAPRAAQPVPVDDDIGNRLPRPAKTRSVPSSEQPRVIEPAGIDDDIGNR